MSVLKCKMCGGDLHIEDNNPICECEYCGTKQTVPNNDDDKKINLFNRANRLRNESEFDKASSVFESIVSEFPEEAEAYWGLCLCKYGIEYVDDPQSGKKIPTCHRTSYESIFDDDNFDLALEYSDPSRTVMYRQEAKEIDRIQKTILEIAQKEDPFDIFICYKETDENGERTKDSVMAQDIYSHLTEKGYKVFFSRITLEDKLGEEYEPYIFSALNSSKVMLAIGTKYEYYNSVWVKNEWARFLDLMKKDKNKYLIPCYAEIDAYDMPKEFRNLQGQDMHKIGFIQDLIRGIERIIPLNETKNDKFESITEKTAISVEPLIKRIEMFLKDKEFSKAREYCEKVLDVDPENSIVYLYRMMAGLKCSDENELILRKNLFNEEQDFRKALDFADDNQRKYLDSLVNNWYETKFFNYESELNSTEDIDKITELKQKFEKISEYNYEKVLQKINECNSKVKELILITNLDKATKFFSNEESIRYTNAISILKAIYKDCEDLCDMSEYNRNLDNKIEEIKAEYENRNNELQSEIESYKSKQKEIDLKFQNGITDYKTELINDLNSLSDDLNALNVFQGKKKNEIKNEISKINEKLAKIENDFSIYQKYNEEISKLVNEKSEITRFLSSMDNLVNFSFEDNNYENIWGFEEEIECFNTFYQFRDNFKEFKNKEIGDSLFFGKYQQKIDKPDSKQYIEWLILDKKDNQLFLISKKTLEVMSFDNWVASEKESRDRNNNELKERSDINTIWENSRIRKWLNDEFYKSAFSENEKKIIETTVVKQDPHPEYIYTDENQGADTLDKIFILSYAECEKYKMNILSSRIGRFSDYARSKKRETESFWLRTVVPGNLWNTGKQAFYYVINFYKRYTVDEGGVCPALWIKLN